jgi:preprotein translocase subunit SecA
MVIALIKKMIGSRNERLIRKYLKTAQEINVRELKYQMLSDEALKNKTTEFRNRLEKGETLDDLLIEAFAVVREASVRTLGLRPVDAQLIGGMVLHQGNIAEMRTGEGKTLAATLPAYLNALSKKSVHVVTANDYLVKRDSETVRPLFEFLGMTVGTVLTMLSKEERIAAYQCDITYGTNNEFGFDYLRDNMVFSETDQVQRGHDFAIVDEVDSILIDEARTPLIISGASEESSEFYVKLNALLPQLKKRDKDPKDTPEDTVGGDFFVDEKSKQAFLTEEGHQTLEKILTTAGLITPDESLYSPKNIALMHYINAVLRAQNLYHRDVAYVVQNGEIVIVDEHTGRAMPGRRWSDGLHQAIEAKEGLKVKGENQTLASITFQNFFRLYEKLSGMTGTADTEAYELHQIYGLEVVVIPTHRAMIRIDHHDVIFLTLSEKFDAIVKEIEACREKGQPVLVGTASIETSELLAEKLSKFQIPFDVLNAKQHEREAKIIANAGMPCSVTIATNMAGRGTDIILGGNWQMEVAALENPSEEQIAKIKSDWQIRHDLVLASGGLHILGTERHESRRIDNQLRGRAGRQGDPGSSRFYLSMEDSLVRIFASDGIRSMLKSLGMGKGEALESRIVTKAIANAQKKVEQFNFDVRKQLLQYDNVANDQRAVIYTQRRELLTAESISEMVEEMIQDSVLQMIHHFIPVESMEEQWNLTGLMQEIESVFGLKLDINQWVVGDEALDSGALSSRIVDELLGFYQAKRDLLEPKVRHVLEKNVVLQVLDNHWRQHLSNMDHLRQSIHLRGYAQKDPKQEFKRESFELFASMLNSFKYEVASTLLKIQIKTPEEIKKIEAERAIKTEMALKSMHFDHASLKVTDALMGEKMNAKMNAKMNEKVEVPDSRHISFSREALSQSNGLEIGNRAGESLGSSESNNLNKVGRNDPCPCGSGKKYKQCHGAL